MYSLYLKFPIIYSLFSYVSANAVQVQGLSEADTKTIMIAALVTQDLAVGAGTSAPKTDRAVEASKVAFVTHSSAESAHVVQTAGMLTISIVQEDQELHTILTRPRNPVFYSNEENVPAALLASKNSFLFIMFQISSKFH